MGRKPKIRPKFFKVLINDFTRQLMLPPAFGQKYKEKLHENVKLRTVNGLTWDVKIEQIGNGKYFFTRGWNKFVKDLRLKLGEFIEFCFDIGKLTFDVTTFRVSGLENEISCGKSRVDFESDEDVKFSIEEYDKRMNHDLTNKQLVIFNAKKNENKGTELKNSEEEEVYPHFEIVMNVHRKSRSTIRKDFAIAAGIIEKKAVVLQYPPTERYWAVKLEYPKYSTQYCMTTGWGEFRKANRLVYGNKYLLEFNPNKNVIQVKEVNK